MAADRDDDADLPGARQMAPDQPATERSAPDRPAGRRAAEDLAGGPELRERQLAEHARYRLAVEASERSAASRDAWSAATPRLQEEWADHKRRYPAPEHQEARAQPDGGWQGDGGRRLTPGQHAEAAKCAADLRDEARESIRPAIERVAAADQTRQLAGLEHMLKGEDRLKEKIADALRVRPHLSIEQALSIVPDPVRFTLSYPSERYATGVLSDIERLKSEGFELIKLKNLWHSEQYKGINSQWRVSATGTRIEVQFHTPESREAKELTHEAYERIRSRELHPDERQELEGFQRRANVPLTVPPGTAEIGDFPVKGQQHSG